MDPELIKEVAQQLAASDDGAFGSPEIRQALGDLVAALIQKRGSPPKFPYDYLLEGRHRLSFIAMAYHAIREHAPISGIVNGTRALITADSRQWYDDGVMFTQGARPFEGLIGLYRNGEVRLAVAARQIGPGETKIGPDDLLFVSPEEVRQNQGVRRHSIQDMEAGLATLQEFLRTRVELESPYQELLENHPWLLGAQYSSVDRHRALNDENIPDFTGVRSRDSLRDIIEIKPPFLACFRKDGELTKEFNDAWNQAERYLSFVRRESDYLRRQKNLEFESPRCWLLTGYQLSSEQRGKVRIKEDMNPAITILTYDDLLAMAGTTLSLIKEILAADTPDRRPHSMPSVPKYSDRKEDEA